ncbi:hypothetical protein DWU95_40295, partial [Burkholderia contaminans]
RGGGRSVREGVRRWEDAAGGGGRGGAGRGCGGRVGGGGAAGGGVASPDRGRLGRRRGVHRQ